VPSGDLTSYAYSIYNGVDHRDTIGAVAPGEATDLGVSLGCLKVQARCNRQASRRSEPLSL